MLAPKLNLNGTSYNELMEKYAGAIERITEAAHAVQETCPHGRDFVGRETGFHIAMANHSARLQKLNEIIEDLEKIRTDIDDQYAESQRIKGKR
jgi:hypothetical protein